jgi:MoaA/NifB/PqqE/SkfB family radical SAM enzyme
MHTQLQDIKTIELELSSYCNASCPLCSRNFHGHNYKNPGFGLKHLTLEDIKKIMCPTTMQYIKSIVLQGNFGDFAMNPQTPDIIDYLLSLNPELKIQGHTNGSVQSKEWWQRLNKIQIFFALDGKDQATHELYRKDTNFDKILENAQAVKDAGGKVVWKMLVFDHNRDQVNECKQMARERGFDFILKENSKGVGPVFNTQKIYLHDIDNWQGSHNIDSLLDDNRHVMLEDLEVKESTNIDCIHEADRSIYISSQSEVFPCCFMGHAPGKWNNGRWIQTYNDQIEPLIADHDCIKHGLAQSVKWFDRIPATWSIKKFSEGRLLYCDSNCSKK